MELFAKSTSIDNAEESLAALISVYDEDCQALASAKVKADIADMCTNAFAKYLREESVIAVIGNEKVKELNKKLAEDLQKDLFGLNIEESLRLLINEVGISADSKAGKTLLAFRKSSQLQKGISDILGKANIFIQIAETGEDFFKSLHLFLSVMEADQMYIEMLQYIQKNCKYDVVCTAAEHLEMLHLAVEVRFWMNE